MATFAMLTKLSAEALTDPGAAEQLEKEVSARIKEHCPEVKWIGSYWVQGPYDYLDIYEAPDETAAVKVALIIRSFGHAMTETWTVTPWRRFVEVARSLASSQSKSRVRRRPAA